ncbi:hypothetical protein HK097_005408 [Rhizophlyctis rosea]|uniref:Acyl-protein thioesterase 1 n=1 Tax=Rhizophlyctis rosea TaxID=64517 RepID=A0AAD5S7M8_9FUNG|nr:hypothetical protein HK097_005408 [Rhizophlyctis rosea]
MSAALRSVVVPATQKHTATLFFLHGLGDSGHGWAPVGQMLQRQLPHVKFVFPHAPSQPVTLNGGMAMPSWHDIYVLAPGGPEDTEGLKRSVDGVSQLIKEEIDSGIPSDRIALGGFSQGGAITLLTAVTTEYKLAGFLALSTYSPIADLASRQKDTNKQAPILQCHGDADEVVPYSWGKMSHDLVKSLGFNVNFKTYRYMGHSSCDEEIKDVATFLKEVLP